MCLQAAGEPLSRLFGCGLNERCEVSRHHLRGICNGEVIPINSKYANDLQRWSLSHFSVSAGVNSGGGCGIGAKISGVKAGAAVGTG